MSSFVVTKEDTAQAIELGAAYIDKYGWRTGLQDKPDDLKYGGRACMMEAVLLANPYTDFPVVAVKGQDALNARCSKDYAMCGADWNDRMARGPQQVVELMRSTAKAVRGA